MILTTLKSYWSTTTALNNALPANKVFLDYVPEGTSFPYCRLTVLSESKDPLTNNLGLTTLRYQLTFYHTDYSSLNNTVDTIDNILNGNTSISTNSSNIKSNKLYINQYENGVYTYSTLLEYNLTY